VADSDRTDLQEVRRALAAPARAIDAAVARLRAATDLPIAVGFGITSPEQAAAIGRVADAVVVGSAIVDLVGKGGTDAPAAVHSFVSALAQACARQEHTA
jgi:tryptophan synthase alpha chain